MESRSIRMKDASGVREKQKARWKAGLKQPADPDDHRAKVRIKTNRESIPARPVPDRVVERLFR